MSDPPGTQWLRRRNILERNRPYINTAHMAPWNTQLPPGEEFLFRQWLQTHNVPFDPEDHQSDYDMRGFWQAMMRGDERAKSAVNPNDQLMHYPDYWKTPYHETFGAESKWALPTAPVWQGNQLVTPGGRIQYNDAH